MEKGKVARKEDLKLMPGTKRPIGEIPTAIANGNRGIEISKYN
jgi:hypothetical protein